MNKTQKTQNATKPAWGIVAVIGAMVAVTMGNSIIMAAIGAALFALGAWKGGYMTEDSGLRTQRRETAQNLSTERRAA